VLSEDSPNHIFVDVQPKGLGQLLGNPRAAKSWIAPLDFADGLNQGRCGSFGSRLNLGIRGIKPTILELFEPPMKAQQG
jgi:hypothetical protein